MLLGSKTNRSNRRSKQARDSFHARPAEDGRAFFFLHTALRVMHYRLACESSIGMPCF
jgi:hypothetical protein